ncbi:hypothetical protein HDV00_007094 [Rhizophlyctis rosea]|nr:hypothetical protein HDV00_007094 [Rhizophlyctis rosea]
MSEKSEHKDPSTCPICLQHIPKNEYDLHYQMELKKLALGNMTPEPSDDVGTTKYRRGAAVTAAQSFKSGRKGKGPGLVDEHEQLLARTKANRLKRKAAITGTPENGSRKRQRNSDYPEPPSTCPICTNPLPSDLTLQNEHVDACLERLREPSPEVEDDGAGQWEEYTWAGQKRVRATALIEGGYAASGYLVHKKTDPDFDEDVDIEDDDTEQFGEAQFGEEALRSYQREKDEEGEGEAGPSGSGSGSGWGNGGGDWGEEGDGDSVDVETDLPDGQDLKDVSADSRLVIESLKERVRDFVLARNPGGETAVSTVSEDHGAGGFEEGVYLKATWVGEKV